MSLVNSQKRTGVLVERTHLSRHGRRALIKFFLQRNDIHFGELIVLYKKPLQRKDVEIADSWDRLAGSIKNVILYRCRYRQDYKK